MIAESLPPGSLVAYPRQLSPLAGHLLADLLAGLPNAPDFLRISALGQDFVHGVVAQLAAVNLAAEVGVEPTHLRFEGGELVDRRFVLLVLPGDQVDQPDLAREKRIGASLLVVAARGLVALRLRPEEHVGRLCLPGPIERFLGPVDGGFPFGREEGLLERTDLLGGVVDETLDFVAHGCSRAEGW